MVNSGMMICSFYLKTRFARNEELYKLNSRFVTRDENHAFDNVKDMIVSFCSKHFNFADDELKMKMFSVDEKSMSLYDEDGYSAVSFTIRSGAYGIESDITDRTTKKVKYRRTSDDADIKDFKCVVFIPKDIGDNKIVKGIIIFQTIATYGVKTITVNNMKTFFADIGLTLEIRSVSVRVFVEKLVEQGGLYKVTFVKNRVSPDSSDNIFIATGREERSYIKPQLKQSWFGKFLNYLERKSDVDVFEIDDKEYDDIKVTFKINGNYRTVALRYIDKFSVVEDLPTSVYNNGKFNDSELVKYMISTAIDYKEKMIASVKCEG